MLENKNGQPKQAAYFWIGIVFLLYMWVVYTSATYMRIYLAHYINDVAEFINGMLNAASEVDAKRDDDDEGSAVLFVLALIALAFGSILLLPRLVGRWIQRSRDVFVSLIGGVITFAPYGILYFLTPGSVYSPILSAVAVGLIMFYGAFVQRDFIYNQTHAIVVSVVAMIVTPFLLCFSGLLPLEVLESVWGWILHIAMTAYVVYEIEQEIDVVDTGEESADFLGDVIGRISMGVVMLGAMMLAASGDD